LLLITYPVSLPAAATCCCQLLPIQDPGRIQQPVCGVCVACGISLVASG
jgi:hypothetical protein